MTTHTRGENMKRICLVLCVLLAMPVLSHAGYKNPTVISNDPIANGDARVLLEFKGDNGEPTVYHSQIIPDGSTNQSIRNMVDQLIDQLNRKRTAATMPILQPPNVIARLAVVPPVPTDKQVWRSKLARYTEAKDAGIVAAAAELAAMKADLEATYQAGFLAD